MASEAQLEKTLSDPLMRAAAQLGLCYIENNTDQSPVMKHHDPSAIFARVCLSPALEYYQAAQDPKNEAMVYFLAYPALEHLPRAEVSKRFGEAVANLNEEIKLYTLEMEGKIMVDHSRVLSTMAKTILNIFARTSNGDLPGEDDDFVTMSYTSQLNTHVPKGRPN